MFGSSGGGAYTNGAWVATGIIGAATTTPDYPLNGTVDEFAVWNRALSATEIASLYRAGSGQRP